MLSYPYFIYYCITTKETYFIASKCNIELKIKQNKIIYLRYFENTEVYALYSATRRNYILYLSTSRRSISEVRLTKLNR